ncbi:hypothetical protein ACFLYH_01450 [Candidatus Dependentiae bacterium]
MLVKKINNLVRFILFLQILLSSQNIYSQHQKAELMSVTNNTPYELYVEEVPVNSRTTLSQNSLPREIPKSLPGISISGIGKKISPFLSGQVIYLPPLLGQGWAWLDEEYQRAQTTIVFQAKGESDLRIALNDAFSTKPIYTVVIGGNNNTRSSILKNGVEMAHITREKNPDAMISIVKGQEAAAYIPFWVCFKNGLILVGKGWPGDNIFLSWRDPNPNPYINKVALGNNDKEIRYTNIMLLPSVITFPPKGLYKEIKSKKLQPTDVIKPEVKDNFIRYGEIVKIKNVLTGKGLQVLSQTIICGEKSDWWIIKGPYGTPDSFKFGEAIVNNSIIRLENLVTRKNLNFKKAAGVVLGGDIGDNWIVNIQGQSQNVLWKRNDKINLIEHQNKRFLFFGLQSPRVKLSTQVSTNTLWQISSYSSPVRSNFLPTGSIIVLRSSQKKYLSLQKVGKKIAEKLNYQNVIFLKNTKEVIAKDGKAVIYKRYLNAIGAQQLQATSKKQQWIIKRYANLKSGVPVKYGDIVVLQSTYGQYLGNIAGENKALPAFSALNSANSFVIIDPLNTLNRGEVLKDDQVAFQAINKSYLSCYNPSSIDFKRYIGDDEKWEIEKQGVVIQKKEKLVFVGSNNVSNKDFNSQFRIFCDAGSVMLQSISNNEFLTAKQIANPLTTQKNINNISQKFLIRRIGNNYFIQSLFNSGILNYNGTFVNKNGLVQGYTKGTDFELEIISKPKIKILEATYGTSNKIYDVTNIVQGLVSGFKLIIPAGQGNKIELFGDPERGKNKQLKITYLDKNKTQVTQVVNDKKEFVIGVKEELEINGELDILGSLKGSYIWLPYSFRVSGRGSFSFEAEGVENIYVGFVDKTENGVNLNDPMYEIIIGAQNNSKIILRRKHNAEQLTYVSTPNVILPGKNKFWCSINNGIILIGKGELGQGLLLAYKDMNGLTGLNTVGISNGTKPLVCKDFVFAPPVELGNPHNLLEEYQQKYQTFLESKQDLIFLTPFKYSIFHRDSKQIMLKDEVGKLKPIAKTELRGTQAYPFSIIIETLGSPIPVLEWMPSESKIRQGLKVGGAMLSSVSGAAGSIPDPRAQIIGAVGGSLGEISQIVAEGILGGETAGVRTEEYIRRSPTTYTDPEIVANSSRIGQLMTNIRQANPAIEEQFKYIIDSYREIFLLIISPRNVDNVLKDHIYNDIRNLIKIYKNHSPEFYNNLIKTLLKAHNNRFLFTLKGDESKRKYIFNGINQIAKSLFKNKNIIEIEELLGEYLWFEQELPEVGNGSIMFEINGEKDVFVAFSSQIGKIRDLKNVVPMYELIIGTKNNTASIFRLENKGYDIPDAIISGVKNPKAVLELGKYKKFWFSIRTYKNKKDNMIAKLILGHDDFIPKNTILEWEDTQPFKNIKYVGIGSWESLYTIKNIKIGSALGQGIESKWQPVYGTARQVISSSTLPPLSVDDRT